jgi:hypothetical protein
VDSGLTDPLSEVFFKQVDAFNSRDLDAFLGLYADDAVIMDGHGVELLHGRRALSTHYAKRFTQRDLHCCVIRAVSFGGRWLAAHEEVRDDAGTSDVLAVFEINNSVILSARLDVQKATSYE